MALLIPITYNNYPYPQGITSSIKEVAGHFDKTKLSLSPNQAYSLHTEYSFGERHFSSEIFNELPNLKNQFDSGEKRIPKLWTNKLWAEDFAKFLFELTKEHQAPSVIEVHPPYSDYSSLAAFVEVYQVFEKRINDHFDDNTQIVIENRCGTKYENGVFILSKVDDFIELSNLIDKHNLNLKITLDMPQLITAHEITAKRISELNDIFNKLNQIKHNIAGLHLWGKIDTKNGKRVAHKGDLNTYFRGDEAFKQQFLANLFNLFNDGVPRLFVPEVNSNTRDFNSIITDLISVGFRFTTN